MMSVFIVIVGSRCLEEFPISVFEWTIRPSKNQRSGIPFEVGMKKYWGIEKGLIPFIQTKLGFSIKMLSPVLDEINGKSGICQSLRLALFLRL